MEIPKEKINKYLTCLISLNRDFDEFLKKFRELRESFDVEEDWSIYATIESNERLASDIMYRLHRKYPKIRDICERILQKNPEESVCTMYRRKHNFPISDSVAKKIEEIEANTIAKSYWFDEFHELDPDQEWNDLHFNAEYPLTADEIEYIRARFEIAYPFFM